MPLSVPTMATFQFYPKEEEELFMHGDTPRGSASLVPDAFGDYFELDLMSWDETWPPQVFKQEQEEEDVGVSEQREMASFLNLRLNHQDVLDAWSDRGPPWVFDHHGTPDYGGEVPNLEEEEERERRRARVLKYREKRQCRLFSKKIRYEVRKLNAEKRPRLKGRFVKGSPEKMPVR